MHRSNLTEAKENQPLEQGAAVDEKDYSGGLPSRVAVRNRGEIDALSCDPPWGRGAIVSADEVLDACQLRWTPAGSAL